VLRASISRPFGKRKTERRDEMEKQTDGLNWRGKALLKPTFNSRKRKSPPAR